MTAAIIRREGQVLIARRSGRNLNGYWEFPGGKIENGETPEACLKRELEEEFGVGAKVNGFVAASRHTYNDRTIELLAYEATLAGTDWALTSHDETRWVEPHELLSYRLAPADIPIAKALARKTPQ